MRSKVWLKLNKNECSKEQTQYEKISFNSFFLLVLIGCGNKEETTIQEVDPISTIEPISDIPGDVTVVSETSELTYAIFKSVDSTIEAKISEDGNKLTIFLQIQDLQKKKIEHTHRGITK